MKNLRQAGDDQLSYDRWQARQASREVAALNGELGSEVQIVALSARYAALKASGQHVAAAALKAQAISIREGK